MEHNNLLLSDDISLSNYRSIFQYSNIVNNETDPSTSPSKETFFQKFLRYFILTLAILLIVLTFPISIWFSIKRIQPLKRCIIYRLGKRLPIKGPGMVFVLPCIDVLDYVDLSTQEVTVSQREQLLTQDGSLIQVVEFVVEISVSNAVRSSTHLKDSRFNVEQFIKLSFANTIGSTHVEDLERKMDIVIRQFTENCNNYINRWGWSVTASKLPNIVVVTRAEPTGAIMKAFKSYFNGGNSDPSSTLINLASKNNVSPLAKTDKEDYLARKLQQIIVNYPYLGMISKENLMIKLFIKDTLAELIFKLDLRSRSLEKIVSSERIDIHVTANTIKELEEALEKQDTSKIEIKTNF